MKPWPKVRLGEVLTRSQETIELQPEADYREITVKLWGKGVVLRGIIKGTEISTARRFVAEAGQFILSRIDARNGAIGVVPPELDGAVVTTDFPLFTPNPKQLDVAFLGWLGRTPAFVELCQHASEGTTNRVRLQEERFLSLEIPLPPLAEQKRVVARIEELAGQIAEARSLRRQAIEEAKALVAAELAAIFVKGLKTGWQEGCLGDYVNDCSYGTSVKCTDDDSGTPVLRMGNIQNGVLDIANLKYSHFSNQDLEKILLKQGDILINRTNSAELVGKCAVFDLEDDYTFASYLIRLRLDTTRADPMLVGAYINSPLGRAYMFRERKQMTGQANVNSTKLKALPLALPPLSEQRRIVAELDALQTEVDALKRLQAETSEELDALLPSVLDKAFKGEL